MFKLSKYLFLSVLGIIMLATFITIYLSPVLVNGNYESDKLKYKIYEKYGINLGRSCSFIATTNIPSWYYIIDIIDVIKHREDSIAALQYHHYNSLTFLFNSDEFIRVYEDDRSLESLQLVPMGDNYSFNITVTTTQPYKNPNGGISLPGLEQVDINGLISSNGTINIIKQTTDNVPDIGCGE